MLELFILPLIAVILICMPFIVMARRIKKENHLKKHLLLTFVRFLE